MRSTLKGLVLAATFASVVPLFAGNNDALDRLRASAAADLVHIQEIESKALVSVTIEDIRFLVSKLQFNPNPLVETPSNALVEPARELILKIATRIPIGFDTFIERHGDDLTSTQVAALILTVLSDYGPYKENRVASHLLGVLNRNHVLSEAAIRTALRRETGGNPDIAVVSDNLESQLEDKMKVVLALFNYGLVETFSLEMQNILVEGLASEKISNDFKVAAMMGIGIRPFSDVRLVTALKKIAMQRTVQVAPEGDKDAFSFASVLRQQAIQTLGQITTQESVQALWEISGMNLSKMTAIKDPSKRVPDEDLNRLFYDANYYTRRLVEGGLKAPTLRMHAQRIWDRCRALGDLPD